MLSPEVQNAFPVASIPPWKSIDTIFTAASPIFAKVPRKLHLTSGTATKNTMHSANLVFILMSRSIRLFKSQYFTSKPQRNWLNTAQHSHFIANNQPDVTSLIMIFVDGNFLISADASRLSQCKMCTYKMIRIVVSRSRGKIQFLFWSFRLS